MLAACGVGGRCMHLYRPSSLSHSLSRAKKRGVGGEREALSPARRAQAACSRWRLRFTLAAAARPSPHTQIWGRVLGYRKGTREAGGGGLLPLPLPLLALAARQCK